MYEKLYLKIIDTLVQDGYVVIENALDTKLSKNLLQDIQKEVDFKKAGISSSSMQHLDLTKRRDKIHWLRNDKDIQKDFLLFTQGLQEYLNRELYLGLNYYEAHYAIYEKGYFYEKHLDSFKNFKNRVVTTVYYLNESQGGELIVYNKKGDTLTTIQPTHNKLVVFMSEKFPHEVLEANSKRYSIAGWFRVDKF